jgi:hypothetical protein
LISDFTRQQLAELTVSATRPLIICDVDDVVVHFLRGFDAILAEMNHELVADGEHLRWAVEHFETRDAMSPEDVSALIDNYFETKTEFMEPIDGAVDGLMKLSEKADVVMLTNLPHWARDQRIRNLRGFGMPFPVITNSGPKGPAIRHLADLTTGPKVFVDDSPMFVRSSHEHAPDVKIIHFLHDPRFVRIHKPFDFVSLTTENWAAVESHIDALIS